jgi:hypothetical protein
MSKVVELFGQSAAKPGVDWKAVYLSTENSPTSAFKNPPPVKKATNAC